MDQERPTGVHEPGPDSLTHDQVREKLRSVQLFQGLDGRDLDEILRISESVLVEAGEHVFEEGERGDHFYIIVHGCVELKKAAGRSEKKLAVLRSGQAFGEMALLNQTPRSASAYAVEDTYMLSVSRAAFGQILGGETLAVRLLRNLSKALWATSVRLASKQAEQERADSSQETLAEFNRLLRARMLPRVTPRVSGYDLAASTLSPRQGAGASAWDWLLLPDGRPVFVVMRALRTDVFTAHRLSMLRAVLRTLTAEPHDSLGALVSAANRGVRSAWIEGLSGPVACALVALGGGGAEWTVAGDVAGIIVAAGGRTLEHAGGVPAVGMHPEHAYASTHVELGPRDKIILLSEPPEEGARLVTSVLTGGYTSSSRDALNKLFSRLEAGARNGEGGVDLSGAVLTRTKEAP